MSSQRRSMVGLLLVVGCLVVVAAFSKPADKPVMDIERYQMLMAERVESVEELQDLYLAERDEYLAILPPVEDFILRQAGIPELLPFDPQTFPTEFLKKLAPAKENSVSIYPLTLAEDGVTRETYFLNADGQEVYALPPLKDYDPYVYLEERYSDLFQTAYDSELLTTLKNLYDPARIEIEVRLIDVDDLPAYLFAQARIAEAAAELKLDSEEEGMMRMGMEGDSNDLWVSIPGLGQGLTNAEIQVHIPTGFTNAVDLFRGTNLLSFWWTQTATNLSTEGTNTVYWTYDLSGELSPVFFAAGASGVDSDADGLSDAFEHFCTHTDANNADTDEDGISDGDEVAAGTDPLDKYSVPALGIVNASGADLVDASTNVLVLRSVNLGGWLAWEQWLVGFQPRTVTNYAGEIKTDDASESEMTEWLEKSVDGSTTLLATDYNVASGTSSNNWHSWVNDYSVPYMGSFNSNSSLGFISRDFGSPGVSNLAIGIAVPNSNQGGQIAVRLGSVNGPEIGRLTTRGCGPNDDYWVAFTEQHIPLSQTISGVTNIYIVGVRSNNIGNLFRFRFYRDAENTRELVKTFQDNYLVTNDLDRLKSLGYNCVRVPFFYRLLEDDLHPYTYKTSGWARLDWVLSECAKRRIYCVLDLHGAPGGVNPWHSSGERIPFRNRLWKNEYYLDRTEKLWGAISDHYKTNPVVVGYDLINEPYPPLQSSTTSYKSQAFSNDILPLLSRLYRVVRSNDTQHVIFMEGNHLYNDMWGDIGWWPKPETMGWSNVCYQFHNYENSVWSPADTSFETQKGACDDMVRALSVLREQYDLPIYVGEFGPGNDQNMEYWTRQLNANDLSWCHWSFRSWGWDYADKPEQGKTSWGLDYRSKATTNEVPNLMTNTSVSSLQRQMGLYSYTNYTDNLGLDTVIQRHATHPTLAKADTCDYFLHTFSADDMTQLSSDWPWNKVMAVGASDKFRISSKKLRLYVDSTGVFVRCRSRVEADARFLVNDAEGCTASVKIEYVAVSSNGSGNEAGVSLAFVRDEISRPVAACATEGIVGRLAYDNDTGLATLQLFAKTNAVAGTIGINLYAASAVQVTYVAGQALELHANATNAYLRYNGTNYASVVHGIDLGQWPNNAVCLVQVERLEAGNAVYVDLDDLCVQRTSVTTDVSFTEDFSAYPTETELGAVPQRASYPPDKWSTNLHAHAYIGQSNLVWLPESSHYGWTWYNPRRTYQQDTRFVLTSTNVIEMQMSCGSFSNGIIKMAFTPEYFPQDLYASYNGPLLYTEVKYENSSQLVFDLVRQWGSGTNRKWVAASHYNTYDPTKTITFQVGSSTAKVYYGSTCIINTTHGTNALYVYLQGAYPHYEYQNEDDTDNAVSALDNVRVRRLSGFEAP